MEDETQKRRAINFDLDGEKLKLYYSQTNPKGAYRKVGDFLCKHGFEHRQFSGYISKTELENSEILELIDEMYEKMPWLTPCASCMDLTDIGEIHDIKELHNTNEKITAKERDFFLHENQMDRNEELDDDLEE